MTTEVVIRIYFQNSDGVIEDAKHDMDLADFGGVVPSAGDLILDAGVFRGLDRRDPKNREMWSVVRRVFNPRDNGGKYIAIVVERRNASENERELVG